MPRRPTRRHSFAPSAYAAPCHCVPPRVHSVPHAAIPLPFCSSLFAPLPLLHVTNPRLALAFLCAATLYFAIPLLDNAPPCKASAVLLVPKQNSACPMQFLTVRRSTSPLLRLALPRFSFAARALARQCHCFSGRIEATRFDAPSHRVSLFLNTSPFLCCATRSSAPPFLAFALLFASLPFLCQSKPFHATHFRCPVRRAY